MCLRSKDYYSNGKYFSCNNMHRFINNCNCGECEECLNMKRSEWYLRMYWEARRIFDMPYNAFMVYDTLTYADEFLPHLSRYFDVDEKDDFSIVDYNDIQLFLKRLRENLWRHYRVDRGRLKYFIASEYGDDHIYKNDYGVEKKATIRPHYHCIFYVDVDCLELDPLDFIREVHYSWKNGNTDNYKTFKVKTAHYGKKVKDNIFCKSYSRNTDVDLRKVTNYVSKYIRKSDKYTDLVLQRTYQVLLDTIYKLPRYNNIFREDSYACYDRKEFKKFLDTMSLEYDEDFKNETVPLVKRFFKKSFPDKLRINYSEKDLYKVIKDEIMKKIRLFHKQSQGFGMYALDNMSETDERYMIESGNMRIDDAKSENGKREIPIPMYYVRKLYYNYRRAEDGRVQWYLTEKGLDAMKRITYGKISRLAQRYMNWFVGLKESYIQELNFDNIDEFKDMIMKMLDGRTFIDLATYTLCYRGRILYQYHCGSDDKPSIEDILDMQNDYNIQVSDVAYIRGDGNIRITDDVCEDIPMVQSLYVNDNKNMKLDDFYRVFCINENTKFNDEDCFRNFDLLLDIIRWTNVPAQMKKQKYQLFMVDYKERLRNFGFKVSQ